jgi:hypothetical protein
LIFSIISIKREAFDLSHSAAKIRNIFKLAKFFLLSLHLFELFYREAEGCVDVDGAGAVGPVGDIYGALRSVGSGFIIEPIGVVYSAYKMMRSAVVGCFDELLRRCVE